MSEPKWTKGPWSEHGKGGCSCGQIFGPDGNVLVAIAEGPDFGFEHADYVPNREGQKANARLITAAPDLDSGCGALLGLIQLILGRDDLTAELRNVLTTNHRIDEARAAQAKARGE